MGNAVPMLDQCCCGCQLRTGTKFVGWCGVIYGILMFIVCLVVAFDAETIANRAEDNTKLTPEELKILIIVFMILAVVISLLKTLFSILLLIGAYQEKTSYYLPFLIFATVALVLEILLAISQITDPEKIGSVFGEIIVWCINIYFFLVVYSDYRQQKGRSHGGP